MTNAEIGNRIKYARDLRGATLDDIAQKVGIAKSTVQRYENGKIEKIKIPVVESIANALRVNPAWIVGKSEEIETPAQEVPKIIAYYNQLNDIGKREATKRVKELTHLSLYSTDHLMPNAAHERTDVEATEEMKEHDDAFFDED